MLLLICTSSISTVLIVIEKPLPNFGVMTAFRPSTETWMLSSLSSALRQGWPGAGSKELLIDTVSLPAPPMKVSSPPLGQ